MASEIAKKVAGTYVTDSAVPSGSNVIAWLTRECRSGQLKEHIKRFCREQAELLDPALVVVETVSGERIHCKIPCRAYDHESTSTFLSEVKFVLDPASGDTSRSRESV